MAGIISDTGGIGNLDLGKERCDAVAGLCHRAGFLERPVRSSAGSRWPQALAQIRKQFLARSFVLAAGPSCRGPRQLVASELAVVPSATPGSPSSNAWPARPRHALSRHISCPTQLRALHRVPSGAGVRACLPGSRLRASTGSVIPLKIGSEVPIGPTGRNVELIGRKRLPDRPDRYEPRAVKRRPKPHPRLNVSRKEAKRLIERGVILYDTK